MKLEMSTNRLSRTETHLNKAPNWFDHCLFFRPLGHHRRSNRKTLTTRDLDRKVSELKPVTFIDGPKLRQPRCANVRIACLIVLCDCFMRPKYYHKRSGLWSFKRTKCVWSLASRITQHVPMDLLSRLPHVRPCTSVFARDLHLGHHVANQLRIFRITSYMNH